MRYLIISLSLFLSACAAELASEPVESTSPYSSTPPEITEYMAQPAILVFSATKEWRHNEGIAGADRYFAELATERGYGLYTTENGAVFTPDILDRFEVIVFNNVTGDVLSPEQREAFQAWLGKGGGWIGVHGSGDASHTSWPWYDKKLIGPEFIGHPAAPQFQDATLVSLMPEHPIMDGIPNEWQQNDEWYSFDGVPQSYGLTPLVGLDESSYSPRNDVYGDVSDLRMGPKPVDHPIIWVGEYEEARFFYSAVGHMHTAYDNEIYAKLLENAFDWVHQASKD